MSGLSEIRSAVLARMKEAGIRAEAEYGALHAARYEEPVLAVGVRRTAGKNMGLLDYLGQRYDEESGTVAEVYGKRLEVTLSLRAYAPGEEACLALAEQTAEALMQRLPSGLRMAQIDWGECRWDETCTMFCREGEAKAEAYFVAQTQEEETTITEFRLRGAMIS